MKRGKQLIQLFLIAGLLIASVACDKSDGPIVDCQSAGTVQDADGNIYNTVKIGNQVWMVENLKTTKYNDGTVIPNITDNSEWGSLTTGAYCNFNSLESNADIYGRLYNWYAVNTGKLAPAGWHVPTDNDWTILQDYLIDNGYNYDGTNEENKIAKSLCAKTNWASSDNEGAPGLVPNDNNRTCFTALPGGNRVYNTGVFDSFEIYGFWWSSTEYNEDFAYRPGLAFDRSHLGRHNSRKGSGFSVRLVRD